MDKKRQDNMIESFPRVGKRGMEIKPWFEKPVLNFSLLLFLLLGLMFAGCSQNPGDTREPQGDSTPKENARPQATAEGTDRAGQLKVTFIELGSVRCVPCQQMVPIMESVEERFGDQIKVVFYDVWTPEGRPHGEKYGISAIPTQVFLDENGEEYFRHEGFFPEEELVKVLQMKGVQ